VASSVVTGAAVGRWWAVGLAIIGVAGLFVGTTLNPCVERDAIECDVNVPVLVFCYFMPPTGALLALGVAIRKRLERRAGGSPGPAQLTRPPSG